MTPAALSHYHLSPLGVATCDACASTWPCHATAWGGAHKTSRCARCGSVVRWAINNNQEEP